jgi:hypothetical protein
VPDTYVTIVGHAVGNDRDGFRTEHTWDGQGFPDKGRAVTNGFNLIGCDDFNIGVVRNGWLVSLWWMDEQISEDESTLARIGVECGFARLAHA